MRAILYIAHGTRSKKGANEARKFVEQVMNRVDIPIQEISFLELTEPLMDEGFKRCVERGATIISVIPLFLLAAGHIKQDIPQTLSSLHARFPLIQILVEDPFGVQEKILDAAAELVRGTAGDLQQKDRLLIVGRGSGDPQIQADFSMIAGGMRKRLGIQHVSVCYLAAAEPRLKSGMDTVLKNAGGRVIVLPYLLFSGLLSSEIEREVIKRIKEGKQLLNIGPLSRHHIFEEIVIERATENWLPSDSHKVLSS
ncbi:sirohydrochlorin chelatase [Peribacillus loiseleuriae]|uniref:Cobalamin biosynthesis protein CbiX n=1 Tax=Peribacillus loiseleuriae TaxID=1679170 RepID=A0A0K9GU88_9BACI|nr:sirohydrochlorin chelatase [Peribacillus loiseleuriae]KMY50206.1 cobalamin biosynthesis protein CbiX [Peribacillus loiseleuriae]